METNSTIQARKTAIVLAARHMVAEKGSRAWTANEQQIFDALIEEGERAEALLELRNAAGQSAAIWAQQREEFDDFARDNLRRVTRDGRGIVRAAMGTVAGSQGGYTVPGMVAADIVSIIKGYGWMRQVASQLTTESGAVMTYPTSDGTSEVGERVGENVSTAAQDTTFGGAMLNTSKYDSKVFAVPIELIQDSQVDILAFLMLRATERIGRVQNVDFTVGSGINQPLGLVSAATVGKTAATGQTVTIIYDDLADMVDSVDEAALGMPSTQPGVPPRAKTGWMFSQTMRKLIRRIKDTNGRPVWLPGVGGELPQLLDYPVFINNDMPTPAASAKSLAFGALHRYMIRDVADIQFFRFSDSSYTVRGQVGFQAFTRAGGNLLDVNAVKVFQQSAT